MGYEWKVTPEKKAKALELLKESMTTAEIASTVGIAEGSIYFWIASDDDFASAWKPQIVANHLKAVSDNVVESAELKKQINEYMTNEDASMAPLLAIKAKLLSQGHLSSMGVLGKIAKGWSDKLDTNNKTEVTGDLSLSDVATMGDGALHDVIRSSTKQG
jgi:hypothetical protein